MLATKPPISLASAANPQLVASRIFPKRSKLFAGFRPAFFYRSLGKDTPHMKRKNNIRGFIRRSVAATLLSCLVLVVPSFSGKGASSSGQAETLGFAERVAYQRAIEEVYWRHRIWPKERLIPNRRSMP